jgi:hypothetical protein
VLRGLGVDYAQGFHHGRPRPLPDLLVERAALRTHRWQIVGEDDREDDDGWPGQGDLGVGRGDGGPGRGDGGPGQGDLGVGRGDGGPGRGDGDAPGGRVPGRGSAEGGGGPGRDVDTQTQALSL